MSSTQTASLPPCEDTTVERTMIPVSAISRLWCDCGCDTPATHLGLANGAALMSGCERIVRRWVDSTPVTDHATEDRDLNMTDLPQPIPHDAAPGWSSVPAPETLTSDPVALRPSRRTRWLVIGSGVAVGVVAVLGATVVLGTQPRGAALQPQVPENTWVKDTAQQVQDRFDLPMRVNSFTTWDSVSGSGNTLYNHYTLDMDPASVTPAGEEQLHAGVVERACTMDGARDALEDGVQATFAYGFTHSDKTISFTVTEQDCAAR